MCSFVWVCVWVCDVHCVKKDSAVCSVCPKPPPAALWHKGTVCALLYCQCNNVSSAWVRFHGFRNASHTIRVSHLVAFVQVSQLQVLSFFALNEAKRCCENSLQVINICCCII